MTFGQEENLRYERQLIIPEIGKKGPELIKKAMVFIAGLGGPGSLNQLLNQIRHSYISQDLPCAIAITIYYDFLF